MKLSSESGSRSVEARSVPEDPLVVLQARGQAHPFFCAHPIGGTAFCYLALARCLGEERPFYAFQSRGIDDDSAPFTRIEDMAANYLEAMCRVIPTGPYLLGGWSLGGVIAFEMARQLRASGQDVGLLVLLDPCSLDPKPLPHWESPTQVLRFFKYLNISGSGELPEPDSFPRGLSVERLFAHVFETIRDKNPSLARADPSYLQKLFTVFQANAEAERSYVPQRFSGKATLLLAEKGEASTAGSERNWCRWIDTVDVHTVPGDHFTMLKPPQLSVLGAHLKRCLVEVD
jgi:thioesterase domain-containing protein